MSFAALESRVNAAVIKRLSNRVASCTPSGGGVPRDVPGLFDAEYAEQLDGMVGGSTPAFTCNSGYAVDLTAGATVVVPSVVEVLPDGSEVVWASVTYEVAEPMPDGAGFTVLRLRKVSP